MLKGAEVDRAAVHLGLRGIRGLDQRYVAGMRWILSPIGLDIAARDDKRLTIIHDDIDMALDRFVRNGLFQQAVGANSLMRSFVCHHVVTMTGTKGLFPKLL